MSKKIKLRVDESEGMHEIRSKKMPELVKTKKKGLRVTARRRRTALKVGSALCAVAVLGVGVFTVGSLFFRDVAPNVVEEGFVTVSRDVPTDGSTPDMYDAIENIAFMNSRFKGQTKWYAEVHGTTVSVGIHQSVNTYKQYNNGVLIMADITSSALVKEARQFCYAGDEVLWRNAASSSYDGLNTVWKTGEPYAHMRIEDFKKQNGLPGTEFTVYIINEETLLSATPVTDHGDGTYSQTYTLDPARDKAPAHYVNQMKFTGGLTDLPTFDYIHVTYTFDSTWQVFSSDISEAYTATMGFSVHCSSEFHTDYEYNTAKAESPAYEDYFKQYLGGNISGGPVVSEPTAVGCLGQAFGSVLTGPVTFGLDLTIGGKPVSGAVYLNLGTMALDTIEVRAKIGSLSLWLEKGEAYLAYGGVKVRMGLDEFTELLGGLLSSSSGEGESAGGGLDTNALLEALGAGEFTYEQGKTAQLSAQLALGGLTIPVRFAFALDEQNNASLEEVTAQIALAGMDLGVRLAFAEDAPAALTQAEKAGFADLIPYAQSMKTILSSGAIRADLRYEGDGFTLTGGADLAFEDGVTAAGTLTLTAGGAQKTVAFAYAGGEVLLSFEGIRIKANAEEAVAAITSFLSFDLTAAQTQAFDLNALLHTLLSEQFAQLISSVEAEGGLQVAIKGTQLFAALSIDLGGIAVGDISLSVDSEENTLSLAALGVQARLSQGTVPEVDGTGYIDIMPYANTLVQLFTSETLSASLAYEAGGLAVKGTLLFELSPVRALGAFTLSYGGAEKAVAVAYEDDLLYLTLDELKVKLSCSQAVSLLSGLLNVPAGDEDATGLLETILSLDFSSLITATEESAEDGNTLIVTVRATQLLSSLGIDFALGDVTLSCTEGALTVQALGAAVTLQAGEAFAIEREGYTDLTPVLAKLPSLLAAKAISLRGELSLNAGTTAVSLEVTEGVLSWKNGIEVYLAAAIEVSGTRQEIELYVDGRLVRLAYGALCVEVIYDDLPALEEALLDLYRDLRETVGLMAEGENPLPELQSLSDLASLLQGSAALAQAGSQLDLSALSSLTLRNSTLENGLLALSFGGMTLDLINDADGLLSLVLAMQAEDGSFSLAGGLTTDVFGEGESMPAMPEAEYLGIEDLIDLFDYVRAAVNTLVQQNVQLSFTATTTSQDAAAYPDGVKTVVSGSVALYAGETVPLHFDLGNKNLYLNTDLYLHAAVAVDARGADESDLYLEIWLLDADADGVLDVYLSLSRYQEGESARNPLVIIAPADELMPVLSSAIAMLGLDSDFLSDWLLSKWLTLETTEQLRAIAAKLTLSIDFDSLFGGLTASSAQEAQPAARAGAGALVSAIVKGENSFRISLNSALLFGKEGLGDLTFEIVKTQSAEGKPLLSAISLHNVYGASATEKTDVSLGVSFEPVEQAAPSPAGKTYRLEGISALLRALAQSATHETTEADLIDGRAQFGDDYTLNRTFYIDGSATMNLSLVGIDAIKIRIDVIAVSVAVHNDGEVSLNARIEYQGLSNFAASIVLGTSDIINGDTQLDLTLKGGMLYLKRTQTTDASRTPLASPVTLYRALPLENFSADMMDHFGFMFNLNSAVMEKFGDMGGSNDGSAQTALADFGTAADEILSSFVYSAGDAGDSWVITLNGASLTGDVLGDIVIRLGTDAEGDIRTLGVETGISVPLVNVSVNADLRYRNPQDRMDEGVRDVTQDIASLLEDGMSSKLAQMRAAGWKDETGAPVYVQGEYTRVSYLLGGREIGSQWVVFDSTTHELYAELRYPDLSDYAEAGYTLDWKKPADGKIEANQQIVAQYTPERYTITFVSDYYAEGFEQRGDKWYYTAEYEYGSAFSLPFAQNEAMRLTAFTDADGTRYLTAEDMQKIFGDTQLTAVWEYIDYTVTYWSEGELVGTQTAHYGDALGAPVTPEKAGYRFEGWDQTGTVTGDMTVKAVFSPMTYTVTLESAYAIEGFTQEADGVWRKRVSFVYDSLVELPADVRAEDAYILRGFRSADGALHIYSIPNVLADSTLSAVWEEIGYDIVFVQEDGTRVTLNRHVGEIILPEELPAVAAKPGYSGAWQGVGAEGYTVTGAAELRPVYTANTYVITFYSSMPCEGYTAEGAGYVRRVEYVYGGAAVQADALGDIPGYWFRGFYTQENGGGEPVHEIAGILGDVTYYALWQDNTVTVRLYSDLAFEGASFDRTANAYYKEMSFNDVYTLDYAPAVSGYQQLGWWTYRNDDWTPVTDVTELGGAEIWAVWIQNIQVEITQFYTNSFLGGTQYNIGGTVTGGKPYAGKSSEIYDGSMTARAKFIIRGAGSGDSVDNPGGNKTVTVSYDENGVGTFLETGMNSAKYAGGIWGKKAAYGGVELTMTFTLGGYSISSTSGACVSIATYTVTFVNEAGETLGEKTGVRADCPFDDYDSRTFTDEIAQELGITAPVKAGYTAAWPHDEVTGDMTVRPVYTPDSASAAEDAAASESNAAAEGETAHALALDTEAIAERGALLPGFSLAEGAAQCGLLPAQTGTALRAE